MKQNTFQLTFDNLRKANMLRVGQFLNSKGLPAHTKADGSDWSPAQWLQAVVGELGEYANFRKKFERGDITLEEFEVQARKELADVQTYLDLLALRCLDTNEAVHPTGVHLGDATADKFNTVSRRVGVGVFLIVGGYVEATQDITFEQLAEFTKGIGFENIPF